jgi:hypothetical protein
MKMLIFPLATAVVVLRGKVRVVQATCDSSNPYTSLTLTLRALYNLEMLNYKKTVAQKVMKRILCPPEPDQSLPLRGKRE